MGTLRALRARGATLLSWLGMAWAALAVLDPLRPSGSVLGPCLATLGWALASGRRSSRVVLPPLLAFAFALCAMVKPEFRADSASYYAQLRSLAFDGDLDFENEWAEWRLEEPPRTPTGRVPTTQPVGPALFWSPFVAIAHAYASLGLGAARYANDGFSEPYIRACALGTLTSVVLGAWLLGITLARREGRAAAIGGVLGVLATSPLLYYAFVVPTMGHGLTFALAGAGLWAWDRVRREPSRSRWCVLAAAVAGLALCRWQAVVFLLAVVPLAFAQVRSGRARASWLAASASVGLLVFSPQMVVWKSLWGHFITLPQGRGYVDWAAPHLVDVLFSANHGLFTWTPALVLGLVGLALGLRRDALLHASGLLVFAATAWVNGSIADWDWAAGDAFGARRFDVTLPFLAAGLAVLLSASARVLRRRPLLAPAVALVFLALWNVGLAAAFRRGQHAGAAPLEAVAQGQARDVRRVAEAVLGRIFGPPGRAFAYKALSAEYLYTRFHPGGTINVAGDERLLGRGWASFANRREAIPFRWALYPAACVLLPLEEPVALAAQIQARAPRKALPQGMTTYVNGVPLTRTELSPEWATYRVDIPRDALWAGPNELCLAFRNAGPGDDESGRVAAAVSQIELP